VCALDPLEDANDRDWLRNVAFMTTCVEKKD